jgi:hypothetical protein
MLCQATLPVNIAEPSAATASSAAAEEQKQNAGQRANDLPWEDAIQRVLAEADGALHYADIAERVLSGRLRKSEVPTLAFIQQLIFVRSRRLCPTQLAEAVGHLAQAVVMQTGIS